tara:strand:- start:203 stop:1351 length:1149 start_codon:yes stop_codon:yes gene_type:complete
MIRKICVVSGSRADYDHLYWLLKLLKKNKKFDLSVIVTGSHLEKKYGASVKNIIKDGYKKLHKIRLFLSNDKVENITKSTALGILNFSKKLKQIKPDIVLLLGDRYEIFSCAISASFLKIPIAHFNGGEVTSGAFDEWIRHSITKMSTIHFVANKKYQNRVIQLGENKKNVFNVGGLSSDNVLKTKKLKKKEIEKICNFRFHSKNILVTFHPVTLGEKDSKKYFKEIILALEKLEETLIIFTFPNADNDNLSIINMIKKFVKKYKNSIYFISLGRKKYLSIMKYCDAVVGNSSSGLLEAPYFNIPTINIGNRQEGREKANTVIDCKTNRNEILRLIKSLNKNKLKLNNIKDLYGVGNTAENIIKILSNKKINLKIKKNFVDA